MPKYKLNFDFKGEDRELLKMSKELTRDQMWTILEKKRLDELKIKSVTLAA